MEVWTGYEPRDQFIPFHTRKQRWAALVCHRRAGKTVACVADLIDSALTCKLPEPRYAYIAPLHVQAKDIAWSYLKRYTATLPNIQYNEAELRVDLPNGGRIRLYGADNYERLRGIYLDGVVLDEYGDMPPAAWSEVIRPALSDRKGSAIFIGTPKGRNHFWEIYDAGTKSQDWYTVILKASETGLIEPQELADARSVMTEDQYEQEFECSFQAALIGAYYGKELKALEAKAQLCSVPYDPALPVFTSWDLGIHDMTSIWFAQEMGSELRFIDYYENSGCGLDHYVKVLKAKDYNYGEHFLPHDSQVQELTTGRTRLEALDSMGLKNVTVVEMQSVEDGINAVRMILPRSWFDAKKCARGVEALRQYQREYDDKLKTFKNKPRHDWASHPADSMRYMALGLPDYKQKRYTQIQRTPNRGWMTA